MRALDLARFLTRGLVPQCDLTMIVDGYAITFWPVQVLLPIGPGLPSETEYRNHICDGSWGRIPIAPPGATASSDPDPLDPYFEFTSDWPLFEIRCELPNDPASEPYRNGSRTRDKDWWDNSTAIRSLFVDHERVSLIYQSGN